MTRFCAMALITIAALGQTQPKRIAFVIGNRHYANLPEIRSVPAELDLVASALEQDGFEVTRKSDPGVQDFSALEQDIRDKVKAGDIAFFYYDGYAIQAAGDNWLIPSDYNPLDGRSVKIKGYSFSRLRDIFDEIKPGLQFFVLDASRQCPPLDRDRQAEGLLSADGDERTVITFSLPPGRTEPVSPDPEAGVFARTLAALLTRPGLRLTQMFSEDLLREVRSAAPGRPLPMTHTQVFSDFYFKAPRIQSKPETPAPKPEPPPAKPKPKNTPASPVTTEPASTQSAEGEAVRVSPVSQNGKLLRLVQPVYPQDARTYHIEGSVRLEALIAKNGKVKSVKLLQGDPRLAQAAYDSVLKWVYAPTVLNGVAVEVVTEVEVRFKLPR